MNPFQDVTFRNVHDFLDYLPADQLAIVEQLRELITACIPDVKEKLAYQVPFYYRHARISFIWPGAVPWGKQRKEGVELGFTRGHLLTDPSYLNKGNRKEVYIKTFYSTKDIDAEKIRMLLYEAVEIDRALAKEKKREKK